MFLVLHGLRPCTIGQVFPVGKDAHFVEQYCTSTQRSLPGSFYFSKLFLLYERYCIHAESASLWPIVTAVKDRLTH